MHQGLAEPALRTVGLGVRYGARQALRQCSIAIWPGELVALVGANGAGKSSLMKAIVGAVPYDGAVVLHGRQCRGNGDRGQVAYVPQRLEVDLGFPMTVRQVVGAARRRFRGLFRPPHAGDRRAVERSLSMVGLDGFGDRPIGQLSGGQLQRVLIARALAQQADVVLLDEPLAGVDAPTAEALVDLLDAIAGAQTAVVVATHELGLVRERFPRCIALSGTVVGDGPPGQVLARDRIELLFVSPAET